MAPARRHALAVCAWVFGPLPLRDVLERIASLGYDGVELFGDLDGPGPAEIRSLLSEFGLEASSFTPADVDIAHPDPAVRGAAVGYYRRLVAHAAEVGCATIGCHGLVSRIRPLSTLEDEAAALIDSVQRICREATAAGVTVAFEVLNRYESCHVNTAADAAELLERVADPTLKVLLDAYHMNIEEPDPAGAIERTGSDLGLFHVADSNREGVGAGHTDFGHQLAALQRAGYRGPIVVECTAPGPDPFTPVKGPNYLSALERQLVVSRETLDRLMRDRA